MTQKEVLDELKGLVVERLKFDPRRAAEIYLRSEPQKLSNEEIQALLRDRSTDYHVAPAGVMAYARFMVKNGMLKAPPESWKDVFFPFVYERGGE